MDEEVANYRHPSTPTEVRIPLSGGVEGKDPPIDTLASATPRHYPPTVPRDEVGSVDVAVDPAVDEVSCAKLIANERSCLSHLLLAASAITDDRTDEFVLVGRFETLSRTEFANDLCYIGGHDEYPYPRSLLAITVGHP